MKIRHVLAGMTLMAAAGCTTAPPTAVQGGAPGYRIETGVDLYVDRDYSPEQAAAWGRRDIAYMARVLNVGSVSIDWDYIVPSPVSDRVEAASFITPSPADISELTSIARSYGLRVVYRVLFWVPGRTEPLRPPHPAAFLANLLAAETPYLRLAKDSRVAEFIAGTERTQVEADSRWSWFFRRAAGLYPGTLSYAMWGGEPGSGGYFWGRGCFMPVAVCGVTAYPDIAALPDAPAAELARAWESVLSQVPGDVLARTEIDEMGIPALDGAYEEPWDWPGRGVRDDQVQARWFAAACTAARAGHLRGIWFWNMPLPGDPSAPAPSSTVFTARPASVAAIRTCAQAGPAALDALGNR